MINSRRFSLAFSAVLAVAVVVWFMTGPDAASPPTAETSQTTAAPESVRDATLVQARQVDSESVAQEERLQGYTAPNRQVTVRTETAGRVEELLVQRGSVVRAGQAIVQLAIDDKPAQLRKAAAMLVRRENEYAAGQRLNAEGHMASTQVDESFSNLEAARADVESIELSIAKSTLRAPFDGIVNSLDVEIGDYVGIRDAVFDVVDNDPLVVVASVSQAGHNGIRVGAVSNVRLVTGEQVAGHVRYLSAIADEATRTFLLEVEIENSSGAIPAGISAEAFIPTQEVTAHQIAPGWLVRTARGEVGIFASKLGIAQFIPVSIISSTPESIWVSGLPDSVNVVVSGQGFLEQGQPIQVALVQESAATQ